MNCRLSNKCTHTQTNEQTPTRATFAVLIMALVAGGVVCRPRRCKYDLHAMNTNKIKQKKKEERSE